MHRYVQSAKIFHDRKILSLSQCVCIDPICRDMTSSPLLPLLDPEFFHRILTSKYIKISYPNDERPRPRGAFPTYRRPRRDVEISTIAAEYCRLHQGELSPEMFDKLTDSGHMPVININCAMSLLQLSVAAHPTAESITCLQKRCIEAMSKGWNKCEGSEQAPILATLPPVVIAELYGRTIEIAKNDLADVKKRLAETIKDSPREKKTARRAPSYGRRRSYIYMC